MTMSSDPSTGLYALPPSLYAPALRDELRQTLACKGPEGRDQKQQCLQRIRVTLVEHLEWGFQNSRTSDSSGVLNQCHDLDPRREFFSKVIVPFLPGQVDSRDASQVELDRTLLRTALKALEDACQQSKVDYSSPWCIDYRFEETRFFTKAQLLNRPAFVLTCLARCGLFSLRMELDEPDGS